MKGIHITNKKLFFGILCIGMSILLFSFHTLGGEDTLNVSYNLSGEVTDITKKELAVTFSHDMIALGGKRDGRKIVKITPKPAGEFLWRGTRTLVFKPIHRFSYSTRYRVTVKKGTRSKTGKKLGKNIRWEFLTPPAYPVRIRFPYDRYPRNLFSASTLFNIWVDGPLHLEFYQKVSTRNIKKYLVINEKESGKPVEFDCFPATADIIEVKFKLPLKRNTDYRITLEKGFKGIEGNRGTTKNFLIHFTTVPRFRYQGEPSLSMAVDRKTISLPFTNRLDNVTEEHLSITRIEGGGGEKKITNFRVWRDYRELKIQLDEESNGGDVLRIRVKKDITNIYGENLPHDFTVRVKLCSGLPGLDIQAARGQLDVRLKSIKKADVTLFKFNRRFLDLMKKKTHTPLDITSEFKDRYIQFEKSKTLRSPGEKTTYHTLNITEETGFDRGLFGIAADNIEPFNYCNDDRIRKAAAVFHEPLLVIHRRNMDFIARASVKNTVFWVYSTTNDNPLQATAYAAVTVFRENRRLDAGKTDRRGFLYWSQPLKDQDLVVVTHGGDKHFAFYKVDGNELDLDEAKEKMTVEVNTDRNLYRPGDTVHIFGILKQMDQSGALHNPNPSPILIEIEGPDDDEPVTADVQPDERGGFSYAFKTREDSSKGDYFITFKGRDGEEIDGDAYFIVDYYQPDSFKLKISGLKEVYGKNDHFDPVISGSYLSGNPMTGDSVRYRLKIHGVSNFVRRKQLKDYRFHLDKIFRIPEDDLEDIQGNVPFDNRGNYRLNVVLPKAFPVNYIADLQLSAVGETQEGKEVWAGESAVFCPGDRVTGIKLPRSIRPKELIKAELIVVDPSGRPADAHAHITVFKAPTRYHGWDETPDEFTKTGDYPDVRLKGKDIFTFRVEEDGRYLFKVDTRDTGNSIVSTSAEFYVGFPSHDSDLSFRLEPENEDYRVGQTINLKIFSPLKGKAMVTVEKEKILDTFIVDLDTVTTTAITVKPGYFQKINVHVTALLADRSVETDETEFYIIDPAKRLKVEISPSAAEVNPASETSVTVRVRDNLNGGKKAGVFVYAVNEGNLQLYRYTTPDPYIHIYYRNLWTLDWDAGNLFSSSQRILEFGTSLTFSEDGGRLLCGTVTDTLFKPIPNARVALEEGTETTAFAVTDNNGNFCFKKIPEGTFVVTVNRYGYEPYRRKEDMRTFTGRLGIVLIKEGAPPPRLKHFPLSKKPSGPVVSGTVTIPDGEVVPGVTVTIRRNSVPVQEEATTTDANGFYRFRDLHRGKYKVIAELEGFNTTTRKIEVRDSDITADIIMTLGAVRQEIVVTGKAPGPHTLDEEDSKSPVDFDPAVFDSILRKDFREVLFFKNVETDENGNAEISFRTYDTLSSYRIMAVAYTDDAFGAAEENITVTKKLLIEEAMPEFARKGDRFTAGFKVSNRTAGPLETAVKTIASKQKIAVPGKDVSSFTVPAKGNQWVYLDFDARDAGEEEIKFYAAAGQEKDSLLKTITVHDNLVSESILDFDAGKQLEKWVKPPGDVLHPRLIATVSPTLLGPAAKIRKKLVDYPFHCLEQETSRIMPLILLDQSFLDRTAPDPGKKMSPREVEQAINAYIETIPEFMNEAGALSYYRGSPWASDFLTLYVLRALRGAREKFPDMDTGPEEKLHDYLSQASLSSSSRCFYQFILSLDREADEKELSRLFESRKTLSILGRVFLYRAIFHQHGKTGAAAHRLNQMLGEFNNSLQVEADFAYFDVGEFSYDRDIPFYSSRFATALLMHAVLEVEGGHVLAPRILSWLMEVKPYHWFATQTNVRVLEAACEYARKVEGNDTVTAVLTFLGKQWEKQFNFPFAPYTVEKGLEKGQGEFPVTLDGDRVLYLTTELNYQLLAPPAKSRGITVERRVYDETGAIARDFRKGKRYQVELLIRTDKEVPYGVIDEPLAAGFEILRQDTLTSERLAPFNTDNREAYRTPWLRPEHSADRITYYTYSLNGDIRINYFIKALYTGRFTWLPTVVRAMYHPQYFGRTATQVIMVK